jgi:hypothetical protein
VRVVHRSKSLIFGAGCSLTYSLTRSLTHSLTSPPERDSVTLHLHGRPRLRAALAARRRRRLPPLTRALTHSPSPSPSFPHTLTHSLSPRAGRTVAGCVSLRLQGVRVPAAALRARAARSEPRRAGAPQQLLPRVRGLHLRE